MKSYDIYLVDRNYYMIIGRTPVGILGTSDGSSAKVIDETKLANSRFVVNVIDNPSAIRLIKRK